MKKYFLILMAFLPIVLSAQTVNTGAAKNSGMAISKANNGVSSLIAEVFAADNRCNAFEVDEEMFKAFCELENADSSSVALFKKIKSVQMIEYKRTPEEQKKIEKNKDTQAVDAWFFQEVMDNLDISGYTQLLKSRNQHTIALLLKKELAPADNEFLLITDTMVIDIRGDIKIKTIYEMGEIMEYVQQILPN